MRSIPTYVSEHKTNCFFFVCFFNLDFNCHLLTHLQIFAFSDSINEISTINSLRSGAVNHHRRSCRFKQSNPPEVDVVDVPLPKADGGISSSGQHVTLGALGKRWELETQEEAAVSDQRCTLNTRQFDILPADLLLTSCLPVKRQSVNERPAN